MYANLLIALSQWWSPIPKLQFYAIKLKLHNWNPDWSKALKSQFLVRYKVEKKCKSAKLCSFYFFHAPFERSRKRYFLSATQLNEVFKGYGLKWIFFWLVPSENILWSLLMGVIIKNCEKYHKIWAFSGIFKLER